MEKFTLKSFHYSGCHNYFIISYIYTYMHEVFNIHITYFIYVHDILHMVDKILV